VFLRTPDAVKLHILPVPAYDTRTGKPSVMNKNFKNISPLVGKSLV